MATVAGSQPKLPTGKGCFKCGKSGHWSRDCTAPPSEWVARAPTQPAGAPTQGQTAEATQDQAPQLQVPVATGKRKRQKPKLTVDNLKERHGIAEVFHTFPKKFKQQFRGRGHEAGDLRRLLEMYIGWQQRIFPYAPFDAFVEGLEKLGSSHVLKMELHELRAEVIKVVQKPQQEGGWTGMGLGATSAPGHTEIDDGGGDGMPEWDDDDLAAMQAEPMEPSRATAPAAAPGGQQPDELELDDDELLDMMGDMQPEPRPQPMLPSSMGPPLTHTLPDDQYDDEELMELAQAGMSQEEAPHWQTGAKSPHGKEPSPALVATVHSNAGQVDSDAEPQKLLPIDEQQPADASAANDDYLQLDDDELLELACASMQPEQEGVNLAVGTAHQAVGSKAGDLSSFDQPEVPLPSSREVCVGDKGQDKHVCGDDVQASGQDASEFDLDDEELLAMAATQLEGS